MIYTFCKTKTESGATDLGELNFIVFVKVYNCRGTCWLGFLGYFEFY